MIHSKTPIAIVLLLILALGAIRLVGGHSTRADFASTHSSSPAGKSSATPSATPGHLGTVSKHPPRDSVFALYHLSLIHI